MAQNIIMITVSLRTVSFSFKLSNLQHFCCDC